MDRKLYKLNQIVDRLWTLSAMTAMIAAGLGRDGRGFAVVAEETRKMTDKMQKLAEQAMFEDKEINMNELKDAAQQTMFLALNAAIESHHADEKGKQAAVCAEEIRSLAYMLTTEIADDMPLDRLPETIIPWAKTPLTSIINHNHCFILLKAGDIYIVENLLNIQEVCCGLVENESNTITHRRGELPAINVPKYLNKTSEEPVYILIQTPWAEKKNEYAVAIDSFGCLFYSPIGAPVPPPADMPLAEYVRECWENENGEPFYFMDWVKMAK